MASIRQAQIHVHHGFVESDHSWEIFHCWHRFTESRAEAASHEESRQQKWHRQLTIGMCSPPFLKRLLNAVANDIGRGIHKDQEQWQVHVTRLRPESVQQELEDINLALYPYHPISSYIPPITPPITPKSHSLSHRVTPSPKSLPGFSFVLSLSKVCALFSMSKLFFYHGLTDGLCPIEISHRGFPGLSSKSLRRNSSPGNPSWKRRRRGEGRANLEVQPIQTGSSLGRATRPEIAMKQGLKAIQSS